MLKGMGSMKPPEFRRLIRASKWKMKPTSGCCKGYKQVNMAMMPQEYAVDFKEFCRMNSGPLPLIYSSKPGELNTPLTEDLDVRTDVPGYKIYEHGEFTGVKENLMEYDWSDMVSFYIGCSFSFEENLLQNGVVNRHLEQNRLNVPMFKTKIKCHPVGPFDCNMVVSMRAIPEHQLSIASEVTYQLSDVHGAPVHIGNPSVILNREKDDPDFGDTVDFEDGDVPVFWACGVTNSQALIAAKCPLAMTHHPGMMLFLDTSQEAYVPPSSEAEKCIVIKYSDKGQRFSILSAEAKKNLEELDSAISDDPGKRGISHLHVPGDFTSSALALSHASTVAITTGFPVHTDRDPPDETDGLPGVYSLASMLQACGKDVTLIVDGKSLSLNLIVMKKQVEAGVLRKEIDVVPYIDHSGAKHQLIDSSGKSKYDVVVATERSGQGFDGKYYTMKGRDISEGIDPIDDLFSEATSRKDVVTIGIGDGGNELGMGKIAECVKRNINLGDVIACAVPADLVIASGTSNWGCHALAFALYALRRCKVHDRYYRRATGLGTDVERVLGWALPTVERERMNLGIVESVGIRDGISPDQDMSVDGFKFDPTHAEKVSQLRKIVGV